MIGFKVKGLRILWPPVFCDDAPSRRGAAPLSILPQWALTSVPWPAQVRRMCRSSAVA